MFGELGRVGGVTRRVPSYRASAISSSVLLLKVSGKQEGLNMLRKLRRRFADGCPPSAGPDKEQRGSARSGKMLPRNSASERLSRSGTGPRDQSTPTAKGWRNRSAAFPRIVQKILPDADVFSRRGQEISWHCKTAG
jgi:hypothetical protein